MAAGTAQRLAQQALVEDLRGSLHEMAHERDRLRRENQRLAEVLKRFMAHLYAGSLLGLTPREANLLAMGELVLQDNGGGYHSHKEEE